MYKDLVVYISLNFKKFVEKTYFYLRATIMLSVFLQLALQARASRALFNTFYYNLQLLINLNTHTIVKICNILSQSKHSKRTNQHRGNAITIFRDMRVSMSCLFLRKGCVINVKYIEMFLYIC